MTLIITTCTNYISDTTRRKREYDVDEMDDEEFDRVKREGNQRLRQ